MINNKNSRRSFLSSIAVLSAGAALGSPSSLFSSAGEKSTLEEKWKKFWQLQGGELHFNQTAIPDTAVDSVCKNHIYQAGKIVYFHNENLLAQPIWIYWGNKKTKPDDVIITFFTNNKESQKVFRINCFELDSLYHLSAEKNERNLVLLLREDATAVSGKSSDAKNNITIKAVVQKERPVKISASFAEKSLTIERKFIYNC